MALDAAIVMQTPEGNVLSLRLDIHGDNIGALDMIEHRGLIKGGDVLPGRLEVRGLSRALFEFMCVEGVFPTLRTHNINM